MEAKTIRNTIEAQRRWFEEGLARGCPARRQRLRVLKGQLVRHEDRLLEALRADLGKGGFGALFSEIAPLYGEINYAQAHLGRWARTRRVRSSPAVFPSRARVIPEPFGVALIIGPWNYPVQLLLSPLVAALAAGNCAVLKPSELAFHTSAAVAEMIREGFDPREAAVVEGGREEARALVEARPDVIFFTGGSRAGREVMAGAARQLAPVILELGGKNPCVVDRTSDPTTAARRIVWGKFYNAGQTCIAPDFVAAHRDIKQALLEAMAATLQRFYGPDPAASPAYERIINRGHLERLGRLLGAAGDQGRIVSGGQVRPEQLYLAPTIVDGIGWEHPLMAEEIFGPILPVLEYEDLEELVDRLRRRPRPLMLLVFTRDRGVEQRLIQAVPSGGVSVNDCLLHSLVKTLPFGGVGESGMGRYHGRAGFEAFSYQRGVLHRSQGFDPTLRFPPFPRTGARGQRLVRRLVRLLR
ncbi:MAG: aldehyde dehydrogenase family protein [Spirochaetales bacterium]|nr:aldehyde dehydrogenase family protein [Spirochaetales bacterium]